MTELKIKYVVLHRFLYNRMPIEEWERDREILEAIWGLHPVHEDAEAVLYQSYGREK